MTSMTIKKTNCVSYDYIPITENTIHYGNVLVSEFDDYVFFYSLRVAIDKRGRGIGNHLVNEIIKDFPHKQIFCDAHVYGDTVMTNQELVAWYERLGFKKSRECDFVTVGTLMVRDPVVTPRKASPEKQRQGQSVRQ